MSSEGDSIKLSDALAHPRHSVGSDATLFDHRNRWSVSSEPAEPSKRHSLTLRWVARFKNHNAELQRKMAASINNVFNKHPFWNIIDISILKAIAFTSRIRSPGDRTSQTDCESSCAFCSHFPSAAWVTSHTVIANSITSHCLTFFRHCKMKILLLIQHDLMITNFHYSSEIVV